MASLSVYLPDKETKRVVTGSCNIFSLHDSDVHIVQIDSSPLVISQGP